LRSAATLAAALLTGSPSPTASTDIFSLLYVRLACLTLINATGFAAQEVKALEDLSSLFYRHSVTNVHLVPWELRVLAVRLQGIGYGDTRRGVMGYYDLARDARVEIGKAKTQEDKELWKGRLRDLGVRVATALVEMGDLAAAGRHLKSLLSADKDIREDQLLRGRLGLLYLKIGNLAAATEYTNTSAETSTEHSYSTILAPLLSMAQGDYSAAIAQLVAIKDLATSADPLVLQNLAVCLMYTGRLVEARPLLESLVSEGHSFPSLIFNLSTIYELCTEKSKGLKMDLAAKLADKEGSSIGWEKLNADFKL
jgi:tetratricopeptide (TPR) repeat protein